MFLGTVQTGRMLRTLLFGGLVRRHEDKNSGDGFDMVIVRQPLKTRSRFCGSPHRIRG
jgi:hypothetical protein